VGAERERALLPPRDEVVADTRGTRERPPAVPELLSWEQEATVGGVGLDL
jgi:hypothetical protein